MGKQGRWHEAHLVGLSLLGIGSRGGTPASPPSAPLFDAWGTLQEAQIGALCFPLSAGLHSAAVRLPRHSGLIWSQKHTWELEGTLEDPLALQPFSSESQMPLIVTNAPPHRVLPSASGGS